jgi:flagellar hook-length control protein FliK
MSAAPVSRSSAPFEIASPSRRSERSAPTQAFTLPAEPPEPANDARPRSEDDRTARDIRENAPPERSEPKPASTREEAAPAERKDRARTADEPAARKPNGKEDEAEKPLAADAGEAPAEAADPAAGKAGEKPAGGQSVEERMAVLAAALEGAPVIGQGLPEQAAAPTPPAVPVMPAGIAAEFLALAALTLQGGGSAKAAGTVAQEGKEGVSETGEAKAATQISAEAALPQIQAAVAVKAEAETTTAGAETAAGIKAAAKLQLPSGGGETTAKAGEAASTDIKAPDGKDSAEAGKAAPFQAPGEVKAAETPAATGQATQPAQSDEAAPANGAPQTAAPLSPQAILAAGPQTLTRPEAPRTELDATAQATAQAQAEAAAKSASETSRPTPLHIVPVEIGARVLAGNKRFDIRLDPAELGRVDVSLEISDKGDVSARLTVDRVETLHMLQRDARTLERAFEQAGLKPSDGGVEISLRDPSDQSGSRQQQRQDEEGPRTRRAWVETTEESALVAETVPLRRAGRLGGVDLSV